MNAAENKPGSYVGLGASIVGAIPIAGDIAKPIIKGEKKVVTEVVEDALKTESKEAAEKLAKQEAEKLAKEEAEKAAKVEAERIAKEQTEKIDKRYVEMEGEGHAPARHGEKINETQLDDRSMHGKDPVTGTTSDAYVRDAAGNPLPHRYSKDATRFNSKEAMVKADNYIKNSQKYKDVLADAEKNGDVNFAIEDVKLKDVFGANYKNEVFGKTRLGSKAHPTSTIATDFTDGTITAVFRKDASGKWNLHTMYPNPKN